METMKRIASVSEQTMRTNEQVFSVISKEVGKEKRGGEEG